MVNESTCNRRDETMNRNLLQFLIIFIITITYSAICNDTDSSFSYSPPTQFTNSTKPIKLPLGLKFLMSLSEANKIFNDSLFLAPGQDKIDRNDDNYIYYQTFRPEVNRTYYLGFLPQNNKLVFIHVKYSFRDDFEKTFAMLSKIYPLPVLLSGEQYSGIATRCGAIGSDYIIQTDRVIPTRGPIGQYSIYYKYIPSLKISNLFTVYYLKSVQRSADEIGIAYKTVFKEHGKDGNRQLGDF